MRTEPTRTREHGTKVTAPASGAERIKALREILRSGYAKIDGVMVDSFSASAIVQVYDAISEQNKAKYCQLHVARMADMAFKLINRARS